MCSLFSHSWTTVGLTYSCATAYTDFTWMEATWASTEEDQTKLWHKQSHGQQHMKGMKLNHGLYTNFLRCQNLVLGDVLSVRVWRSLCVRCHHVKVTSEHSDDTLEWLSHVPWIGWIVQADENVSRNVLHLLHNHTGFKPYCVLKMKKEATCVFTEIQLYVF